MIARSICFTCADASRARVVGRVEISVAIRKRGSVMDIRYCLCLRLFATFIKCKNISWEGVVKTKTLKPLINLRSWEIKIFEVVKFKRGGCRFNRWRPSISEQSDKTFSVFRHLMNEHSNLAILQHWPVAHRKIVRKQWVQESACLIIQLAFGVDPVIWIKIMFMGMIGSAYSGRYMLEQALLLS